MTLKKWCRLFCLAVLLQPVPAICQTYVTWQGLEPDKLASIWLIKRYVDPVAEFILVPKGDGIKKGIPFDIPSASLKRSHSQSTFERILQEQNLNDERLLYIGKIIHDIEINTWDRKKFEQTSVVQDSLREIIDQEADEQKVIDRAVQFFDSLYNDMVK
jgi:hypothetical protein